MTEPTGRGTPVAMTTPDLAAERVRQLQALFPDVVTEGRVDFDKLRAALGDAVNGEPERYSFTWAGKRDAIHLLQMPSRATLLPAPDESVNWDETKHLFIEGDNLEVLKLLYKAYFGRVKMIYIDPPYNTGNDFIYPDNFADSLDTYLRITGQRDENGNGLTSNPETSGRYHSAWLSMMYPRLFVARQLLRDDGVIFVSIDDHEVHNLRMLMNEVFGEENFIAELCWNNVYGGGAKSKHVVSQHEYVLLFSRNLDALGEIELPPDLDARRRYTGRDEKYPIRGPFRTQPLATNSMDQRPNLRFPIKWQGEEIWPERQWQWSEERVKTALANNELIIGRNRGKWSVRYKQYLRDEMGEERTSKLFSVLTGPWGQEGTAEIREYFSDGKVFPFPKPSKLIKHFLSSVWRDDSAIVLDFFAGSCPTAQAVLELNREHSSHHRFIMVQLPEATPADSTARQQGFETIADIGKERIRRVAAKLHDEQNGRLDLRGDAASEDLGFRVFKLAESHYRRWTGLETRDAEHYAEQMELFIDPLLDGWQPEGVIWEVAIKEGYGLTARIEPVPDITTNRVTRVSDPDTGQSFSICLDDTLDPATVEALDLSVDDLFICRDVAADDTLMANLALNCRFKTI